MQSSSSVNCHYEFDDHLAHQLTFKTLGNIKISTLNKLTNSLSFTHKHIDKKSAIIGAFNEL